MKNKQLTLVVVSLLVVVLSVSLAWFTTQILGKGKDVSVTSTNLQVLFTDTDGQIAGNDIEPGWSNTSTFSIENKSKNDFNYDIILKDYKNTTVTDGYLVYKITSTNGYNMTEYKDMPKDGEETYDATLARNITIKPGTENKQEYTIEIKYINANRDQSEDMNKSIKGVLYITESKETTNPYTKGTLGYQIMEDNKDIKERTNFNTLFKNTNIGVLYKATEDNTDVYYFSGDTRNNWVKFGTWQEDYSVYRGWHDVDRYYNFKEFKTLTECESDIDYNNNCTLYKYANAGDAMYWRIIRTNKDGSIRLLYHGTDVETTTAYIGKTSFNLSNNDTKYVGYMYGTSGSLENNRLNTTDSTIKAYIDNWYKTNMLNYTKYLSNDAVYCNDRSITKGTFSLTESFEFAAYTRRYGTNETTPTYNCSNIADAFSANNEKAKLTYPVALITFDEATYIAGGEFGNINSWLFRNAKKGIPHYDVKYESDGDEYVENFDISYSSSEISWDTMTPVDSSVDPELYVTNFYISDGDGYIGAGSGVSGVRPVLSLNKDVIYKSGDGNSANPYIIEEN